LVRGETWRKPKTEKGSKRKPWGQGLRESWEKENKEAGGNMPESGCKTVVEIKNQGRENFADRSFKGRARGERDQRP